MESMRGKAKTGQCFTTVRINCVSWKLTQRSAILSRFTGWEFPKLQGTMVFNYCEVP